MSAKSRGCTVIQYLVLQQLVLVTNIMGQTRSPPRPSNSPSVHPRISNPHSMYQNMLNQYHTPPAPSSYSRFRNRTPTPESPLNHKNSLYIHPPSNTSPNLPEFTNHKTNSKYRQSSRRPSSTNVHSASYKHNSHMKSPSRGQDRSPPYLHTSRPEQLHEYQQNYYKLQQSQKQFFNQPIKQLYQQQQEQLAYHKGQLKLEEQHAQHSQKIYTRVKFPGNSESGSDGQKPKKTGYIVTPHPENYDPFTSKTTAEYTLNFDRNPFKIGSETSEPGSFQNFAGGDGESSNKTPPDSPAANSNDIDQSADSNGNRPNQKPILTSNQIRALNTLKGSSLTPAKSPTSNRTISTNISLLSNNIDSKHKHLIKFISNSGNQSGGWRNRMGTSEEESGGFRRSDSNYYSHPNFGPDVGVASHDFGGHDNSFTPSYGHGNVFSVPSSPTRSIGVLSPSRPMTTPRYPLMPKTQGQPFSISHQEPPGHSGHDPGMEHKVGHSGPADKRLIRGSPLSNVTHLFGLSLNDSMDNPRSEALHYYGRLSDDEDREELFRMLQNVTLLSDIRKQILDSISTHMTDGIDVEYPDTYPDASNIEDDDSYVFSSAPPRRPEITSTHRDCRLRSRRYISDGQCTSPQPITEAVCADSCTMPSHMFNSELGPELGTGPGPDEEYFDEPPRGVQYSNYIRRNKGAKHKRNKRAPSPSPAPSPQNEKQDYIEDLDVAEYSPKAAAKWWCDAGETSKKRINLLCNDGSLRQYALKIIASCRCRKHYSNHSPYLSASPSYHSPSFLSGPSGPGPGPEPGAEISYSSFPSSPPEIEHPISLGSRPVKTIIKPIPVPVYPSGHRGKRRWKKRKYKSKHGHHHHHHYPNHKPHKHHGHHKRPHSPKHHYHGKKKHKHNHKPEAFRPLSKKHWEHIRKKLSKVMKKHKYKKRPRKGHGHHHHHSSRDRSETEGAFDANRRLGSS